MTDIVITNTTASVETEEAEKEGSELVIAAGAAAGAAAAAAAAAYRAASAATATAVSPAPTPSQCCYFFLIYERSSLSFFVKRATANSLQLPQKSIQLLFQLAVRKFQAIATRARAPTGAAAMVLFRVKN